MKVIAFVLLVSYASAALDYDCRYGGEAYWCSSLSIASKCGVFDHCMETVWKNLDLSGMKTNDVCEYCEQFIGDIRARLDGKTEAELKVIFDEACDLIPDSDLAQKCKEYVNNYVDEVFEMLRGFLDPKTLCASIGLCPGLQNLKFHPKSKPELHHVPLAKSDVKVKVGDQCAECKSIIEDVENLVFSKSTEAEIEKFLKDEVCARMQGFAPECDAVVDSYLPELISMLKDDVNPEDICEALSYCAPHDRFILQKMRLKKMLMAKVTRLQSGEYCAVCEMTIQELKSLLSEDTIQKDVENFIKKNLCSKLGSLEATCQQDVQTYGALLFELITSELNPNEICTAIDLCGQKKAAVRDVKQSVECVLCEFIMKEVAQQLADNATEGEIIKALDRVCSFLPDTLSQQCKQFIDTYGKAIMIILKETLDPASVCTSLGLCKGNTRQVVPLGAKSDPEVCAICETVFQYLDSILEENATKEEIEAALEKVCNYLPETLRGQCEDLVKQYEPMIVQLILEAANPKKVCKELGLCTSLSVPVIEPVIVPQRAQMVGVDECTYGPAFWCASYDNAKKCKATKHCVAKVWKNGVPRM